MPPRLARSGVQAAAPKTARNKKQKRKLNAYAIASHSAAAAKSKSDVRSHRLGEVEDDRPAPKRRRGLEDDDAAALDDEDLRGAAKRRKATFDDGDVEEGSDSEGNEWTLGGLAEDDDDSDLDSEEAFGESDEERFEGFTFRGSSGAKAGGRKRSRGMGDEDRSGGIDLDEAEGGSGDDGEDEDDFGEEGVDLATTLDDEDDGRPGDAEDESGAEDGDEAVFESESEGEDDDDDEDESDDEERNARMRDRLEALDGDQQVAKPRQVARPNTLSVDDLLADLDPSAKRQFAAATKTRKRSERPTTLAAPLPKRQQDRLNREAASQKAKEQLDRWRDTVIQNRRADFLSFPLKNPDQGEPLGKDKFLDSSRPRNELEENIQRIMEESGVAPQNGPGGGGNEEDALMNAEGMAEQKMDVEEVMRRRAELRKARELLFYEERRAKRIAKIKSKSYRRVHRKEKARLAEREQEERRMMGLEDDEDEREKKERERAEQRMSTKHRDSKWAKQLKQTGRAAWDEGARDSVNEEARRREELRRRVEGKSVGSGSGSEEDAESDEGDAAVTWRQLEALKENGDEGPGQKGLAAMKFMRDADARRRAQNDEDVERMRKEMALEDAGESEDANDFDDQGLGRAIFGPQGKKGTEDARAKKKAKKAELEEGSESEDDGAREVVDAEAEMVTEKRGGSARDQKSSATKAGVTKGKPLAKANGIFANGSATARDDADAGPSWFAKGSKKGKKGQPALDDMPQVPVPESARPSGAKHDQSVKVARPEALLSVQDLHDQTASQPGRDGAGNTEGWTLVTYKNGGDDYDQDSSPEPTENPTLTRAQQNAALQTHAFAGDDVAAAFHADKKAQESSEDEKEVSSHLPGWGSWTGTGLSKGLRKANARAKHHPLFKTKAPGVRPANRKDAKLENVIISEKGDRGKGKKYLAPSLPREFGGKGEYEGALRRPLGSEWGTKEAVQRSTRPRVVVKKGVVVEAMQRPTV